MSTIGWNTGRRSSSSIGPRSAVAASGPIAPIQSEDLHWFHPLVGLRTPMASTSGYSGTPLPRKLGIKPGHRVAFLAAPAGFEQDTLGELPGDVRVARRAGGRADVIVSFHTR